MSGWLAVLAPKGTPASVVARINADMKEVLSLPDMLKRMHDLGVYLDFVNLGTPEALAKFIRQDSALMESIVKAAGIKSEGQGPN